MGTKGNQKHLCDGNLCTGCYACVNKCPKNAIVMRQDKDGAYRPFIDEASCVGCGMCDNVCPVLHEVELRTPQKVYAAYASDDIRKKSASGGIATMLAKRYISDGGVVYGAARTKGIHVEHIRVTSMEDVPRIQGAKYVHSHLGTTMKDIAGDLAKGRPVLFIGTPCQVAAVRNSIGNAEKLFCIDLVCHGVPSWKTLHDCMVMESGLKSFDDIFITFRDEEGYNIKIRDKDGQLIYRGDLKNSYYFNGFMESYIYRNNCYKCRYAQKDRCGDITLGDFWGLDVTKNFDGNIKNGINVVLINTEKGRKMFDLIKDSLSVWERTLEEAVSGNGQLRHSPRETKNHKRFAKMICYMSADKAILLCNVKKTLKLYFRKKFRETGFDKMLAHFFPKLQKKL